MGTVTTGVVITGVSFLIGAHFTHWSVDHRTLWTQPVTPSAVSHSLAYYSDLVEAPVWFRVVAYLITVVSIFSIGGKMVGAGMMAVFDGASFVLVSVGIITHMGHITGLFHYLPVPYSLPDDPSSPAHPPALLRSLQDIASSHTVISVALTGVIALQVAGWYVERSVRKAEEKRRAERRGRRRASSSASAGSGQKRIAGVDSGPTQRLEVVQTPTAASPPPGSAASSSSPSKRRKPKKRD